MTSKTTLNKKWGVIADAGQFITLALIDKFDILDKIFFEVKIDSALEINLLTRDLHPYK